MAWTEPQIRAYGKPVINTLVKTVYSAKMVRRMLFRDMLLSEKEALEALE